MIWWNLYRPDCSQCGWWPGHRLSRSIFLKTLFYISDQLHLFPKHNADSAVQNPCVQHKRPVPIQVGGVCILYVSCSVLSRCVIVPNSLVVSVYYTCRVLCWVVLWLSQTGWWCLYMIRIVFCVESSCDCPKQVGGVCILYVSCCVLSRFVIVPNRLVVSVYYTCRVLCWVVLVIIPVRNLIY